MREVVCKSGKCILSFAIAYLLLAVPGMGQISYKAIDKHERYKRKSIKEANNTDAAYKDTHLNINTYTFKRGEAGRKRVKKRNAALAGSRPDSNKEPLRLKELFRNRKKSKKQTD